MTPSTEPSRAASAGPSGSSNGTPASPSVRLARTMRWATVGSGSRKARAISAVLRPPSRRRVSAARASGASSGWQAMNIRRSRSSPTGLSSIASGRRCAACSWASRSCTSASSRSRCSRSWRRRSIARCRAVVISQAPGRSGTPSAGQRSSAATSASCASSSARSRSRTSRSSAPTSGADSMRQIASIRAPSVASPTPSVRRQCDATAAAAPSAAGFGFSSSAPISAASSAQPVPQTKAC